MPEYHVFSHLRNFKKWSEGSSVAIKRMGAWFCEDKKVHLSVKRCAYVGLRSLPQKSYSDGGFIS